jgi:phage-related protein
VEWRRVTWERDSKEVINTFSEDARENLGNDLRRVQAGKKPLDSKPMKTVGRKVFELRDQDNDFWYRLFYVELEGVIYVLHCFTK